MGLFRRRRSKLPQLPETISCAVCREPMLAGPQAGPGQGEYLCLSCGSSVQFELCGSVTVGDDPEQLIIDLGECASCHQGQAHIELRPDPDGITGEGVPAVIAGRWPYFVCSECGPYRLSASGSGWVG